MNGSTENERDGQASPTVENRSLVTVARPVAHWLCSHESAAAKPREAGPCEASCVCEKLRKPLSVLAGSDGYKALISRALALARTEDPSLGAVEVLPDGSLKGIFPIGLQQASSEDRIREEKIVAHLINLLISFIGYPLTLRIVRDIWPDVPSG